MGCASESSLVLSVWGSGVVDSRKQGTGLFDCLGVQFSNVKKAFWFIYVPQI